MAIQTKNAAEFTGLYQTPGQGLHSAYSKGAFIGNPDAYNNHFEIPWGGHYYRPTWGVERDFGSSVDKNAGQAFLQQHVESAPGIYDFSHITDALNAIKAEGGHLALAPVMVTNTHRWNSGYLAKGEAPDYRHSTWLPLWLDTAANRLPSAFPEGPNSNTADAGEPDWSQTALRDAYSNMMYAMAAQFDKDPCLSSVDIRGIGTTGEWATQAVDFSDSATDPGHFWTMWLATQADFQWMHDLYNDAWVHTPVIGFSATITEDYVMPGFTNTDRIQGPGVTKPSKAADMASIDGNGLRNDCWGAQLGDYLGGVPHEAMTKNLQRRPTIQPNGIIALECCDGISRIRGSNPGGGDGFQPLGWVDVAVGNPGFRSGALFDINQMITETRSWGPTQAHFKNTAIPDGSFATDPNPQGNPAEALYGVNWRPQMVALFRDMGFRTWMKTVQYNDIILIGSNSITVDIENKGLAPAYHNWMVSVRFLDGGTVVHTKQTNYNLIGDGPGAFSATGGFSINTSELTPGQTYDMEVGITLEKCGTPYTDIVAPVASNEAGTDNEGWLPLGPVTVQVADFKVMGEVPWTCA